MEQILWTFSSTGLFCNRHARDSPDPLHDKLFIAKKDKNNERFA